MPINATNTFEGGSNGVAITVGNSGGGSGNAFDAVDGSNSMAFDTTRAAHGSVSAKVTQAASPAWIYLWWFLGSQSSIWGRVYYYATGNPSQAFHLVYTWSGAAYNGFVDINADGTLSAVDAAFGNRGTSAFAVTLNAWNRIEWRWVGGASGFIEAKLFPVDSTTATGTLTSTVGNFYGTTTTEGSTIAMSAAAANHVWWADDATINNTGYPGPVIPPSPGVQSHLVYLRQNK